MRHDWIFDVLTDLKAYAVANGMIALAVKADEAIIVARKEVIRTDDPNAPPDAAKPGSNSH